MRAKTRISNIVDESGVPFELPVTQRVHASHFDVINRWGDSDNWAYATNASGDSIAPRGDRSRMTAACRFEFDNNPYAKAMVLKLGNEVISTGPVLEITPRTMSKRSEAAAKSVERVWADWADESLFRDRLFLNVTEPVIGGDIFNVFRNNFKLKTVKVDFEQYESIQFQSPWGSFDFTQGQLNEYPYVDGMRLDARGNVEKYIKLKYNPGSSYQGFSAMYGNYDELDPSVVAHIYRKERPSQYRATEPQMAPCVEQFAALRRFSEATIETAERQASIMGVWQTNLQSDMCAPGPGYAKLTQIGSAQLLNAPEGWEMKQFMATQPVTGYSEFVNAKLHEIMSCLLLPWNVASGDSSDYNFSSARMDHLIFDRVINIIRADLERKLMNRFFSFWFEFAMFTPGVIPTGLGAFDYRWYWPKRVAVDPEKEAKANAIRIESGQFNEPEYWQSQGMNWKEAQDMKLNIALRKEKREAELRAEMGLPPAQTAEPAQATATEPTQETDPAAVEAELDKVRPQVNERVKVCSITPCQAHGHPRFSDAASSFDELDWTTYSEPSLN